MTKGQETHKIWLETAFYLFSEVGPDGLNIKSLSEAAKLPRSNFYYYFTDKEDLMEQLFKLYIDLSNAYREEVAKNFNNLFPDLYEFLANFKQGVKFHRQLFNNRHIPEYEHIYYSLNRAAHEYIVPKVKEYYNLDMDDNEIMALWETITDTWYCRINFDDFTAASLSKLAKDIINTVLPLTGQKSIRS